MKIGVISLFPEMFAALTDYGVCSRAIGEGTDQVSLQCWNPRDFTTDRHQTVDDRPYGGGPGMVMMVEPLLKALQQAKQSLPAAKVIFLSPQGRRLSQASVENFAAHLQAKQQDEAGSKGGELIFIAGRYEGVDERFIATCVDEEWSIGDYVLSGGELAVMVILDAVLRLLPGVLGHDESAIQDSFVDGLLDYPHYTRPEQFDGQSVPEVLLSGNHEKIRRWRLMQALGRTGQRRPDLLEQRGLSEDEQELLAAFARESNEH